jgi:NH3-dependent NAD+ synthetase
MLPSKFTSKESIEDAEELAKNLGIVLKSIDIKEILESFLATLSKDTPINKNSIRISVAICLFHFPQYSIKSLRKSPEN